MNETLQRSVELFLTGVDKVLGPGYAAILFGSAVRGGHVAGRSDINLLLILESAAPERIRSLRDVFGEWTHVSRQPPLLLTRAEWMRAADAFPIEITDIKSAYRVLRGTDLVAALTVNPGDLRGQLEHELRGKVIRLRQAFAVHSADPASLARVAIATIGSYLVLLRSTLALRGRASPADAEGLLREGAGVIGFSGSGLEWIHALHAGPEWTLSPSDFEAYLAAVEATADHIDQLQLGES